MKLFPIIVGLILLTIISLTACNADAPAQPEPAPAAAVADNPPPPTEPAPEPVIPTDTPTPSPSPTATPLPPTMTPDAPTATSSPSPSPVPEPVVRVDDTLASGVNVRGGPGTNYPVLTQFEPGQTAPVLGQNENRDWWQIELPAAPEDVGWIFGELAQLSGDPAAIDVVQAPPPPPTATPAPVAESEPAADDSPPPPASGDELAETLRCGQDFCVTYQAMVPIWENGGCIGNHSIYVTVLEGPPPGRPLDGIVIGDTFNNLEVASGDKGPGTAEVTLWMNSMTLKAKRHIDGTPFTSEESFNFTAHDELIPAELLAAMGYCDGNIETCEWAQQNNQVCRGHYSWRVTFHKFD